MNLVPVTTDSILVGQPLPCALLDQDGVLLASQGYMVSNREDLEVLLGQRSQIYIDADQANNLRRGYFNRLNNLVLEDKSLGQIADVQLSPYDANRAKDVEVDNDVSDWLYLQHQAHALLRDNQGDTFLPRLERLQNDLERETLRNPDAALFALIHLSGSEIRHYSATHAMLVSVICCLAARDVLKWPAAHLKALSSAALTMNISMTVLQDRLAAQKEPLTPAQLQRIQTHAPRSVDMLQQMGVSDALWLEAVLNHSTKSPGQLASRSDGQRLARLIQRADMFAARMSPRITRAPEAPGVAMQSCYFDENKQIDEAGAALIKAVGIYSPGTYVKLTSHEVAVVVKRGINTTMPRVAVLINRHGMPTGEPILRDTSQAEYRITTSLPFREVKVTHTLERLMAVTRQAMTERIW